MSQQEKARYFANCQIATESAVVTTDGSSTSNVPEQKRKEDAKQILYLYRV